MKIAVQTGYSTSDQLDLEEGTRSKTIGVVIPDILNPYFAAVCACLNDYIELAGYTMFICSNNRNPALEIKQVETFFNEDVAGLIVAPNSYESILRILDLTDGNIPTVFFTADNRKNPSNVLKSFNYVCIDDEKAAYNAVKYFVELGHKRICYVGGIASNISVINKVCGYKKALTEAGMLVSEENIYYTQFNSSDVKLAVNSMIRSGSIPDAILAVNDSVALMVISALEEKGIKIPKDLSIIGFDNIMYSSNSRIELTTIDQPKAELASNVVRIIVNEIQKGEYLNNQEVILESSFIIRKSCKSRN